MSQYKRKKQPGEQFTKAMLLTMQEPAWAALSSSAQALYPWLKFEWHGTKFNNNGKIRLSVRQAAKCMGVTPDTVGRAFHSLQAKGFIVITEHARLGIAGEAQSPAYEITELKLPQSSEPDGRKLYRGWEKGHDYPVSKLAPNNPSGRNGKTKPCHENHDSTVINIMTGRRKPS